MNQKAYNYLLIMSLSTLAFVIITQFNSIQSTDFLIGIFSSIVATIALLLFIIVIAFVFQFFSSTFGKTYPNGKTFSTIETAFKIWRVLVFILIFGQSVKFLGCVK